MKYSQIPAEEFKFYTRTWKPSSSPKATVLFIHGFAEHCDRYDHVFKEIANAGIQVSSYDSRGFGQSATKQTAGVTGGWNRQLADIDHFVKSTKIDGVPQFLWGHSMGGGLTLKYALDGASKQQLSGVIASAPLIGIPAEGAPNSIVLKIGSLAAHLVPDQIIPVEVPVKTCTRDPEFLQKGEADELLRPFGSLRGVSDMIYGGRTLLLPENTKRFEMPILLVHGTGDVVTSHIDSRAFFDAIPVKDKTYKEYPGSYHEIHNDLDREAVIRDCKEWLVNHAKQTSDHGQSKL